MLWIPIDRTKDAPLIRQVYRQIRTAILQGELLAGEKLPSTRELANELHVSRNVVIEAYDQLLAEGYLVTRQGAGTYVAEGTYLEQVPSEQTTSSFEQKVELTPKKDMIDFRSGIPDLTFFPRRIWAKLSYEVCHDISHSLLSYGNPEGVPEFRAILARYLVKTRGVHCQPEQLVITSGATQALTLVAKLLLSEGEQVVIEDPITHDIQSIFKSAGASLYPVPVDEQGMRTELLPSELHPSFVFVTPSHQFPVGGALPIQRRIQLIQFAREKSCYLVEDDYDSEFRYEGAPVSSLQGLD